MKKYLLSLVLAIGLMSTPAFAAETLSEDGLIGMTIYEQDSFSWHDKIDGFITIYNNNKDEKMDVSFSGTCFINAKITGPNNLSYDQVDQFCISETKRFSINPGGSKSFEYDMSLQNVAGAEKGSLKFNVYLKPAIYIGSTRYSNDTYELSQNFNFTGNVEMNLNLETESNSFKANEVIQGKWVLDNFGMMTYSDILDACDPLIEIYEYYSKELIYKTDFQECIKEDNDISVYIGKNTESDLLDLYKPNLSGKLEPGVYTMKIKLNSKTPGIQSSFSQPFRIIPDDSFSDISGHWGEEYINQLYKKGIVNGYEDGRFLPDKEVSKAEFIKIALIATGQRILDLDEIDGQTFTDVTPDDWYFPYIETAVKLNLIDVLERGYFPNKNINREEASMILFRTLGQEKDKDIFYNIFTDISEHLIPEAMTLYNLGIIGGYEDTSNFGPYDPLSRAAASKIALIANEKIETGLDLSNNKNIILRYSQNPSKDLTKNPEKDLIVCANGEIAYFEFDPNLNEGSKFFKTIINKEEISRNIISILYQKNFFQMADSYHSCTEYEILESTCSEDTVEDLAYYFSSLNHQVQSYGENSNFKQTSEAIISYIKSLIQEEDWQSSYGKTYDKFFGDNFCL